ncbi:hypothetical protein L0668_00465 [Paraglaciecola aquimarina]|uniref:Uncharacterized protein n=1 Tax=Paraglaciecola algarum TaxID=3050085 RepID=A0ABS9D1R4_9ALTE|nr:hypothetical protein [Paraglaciecola sp. G1-23]MCF2946564.1 hypothetical protein [Paraglaciecola sp. G1-23]
MPSQHQSQLFYGTGICLSHGFFCLLFLAVEEKSVGRNGFRLKKAMDGVNEVNSW